MATQAGPGPLVDDTEDAYRAILYPWQWVEQLDRPSSAAFDEDVFSVELASRTTPDETRGRFQFVLELVAFNCGDARGIGLETRDELDPLHPDNKAHAHVYFTGYHDLSSKQRKAKARRLATALGEGGATLMPLGNYEFSRQFTWLNDRLGVSWQLNLA